MTELQVKITSAIDRLQTIPFFPKDEGAQEDIAEALFDMVNWPEDREERDGEGNLVPYVQPSERLDWLVKFLVNNWVRWDGIALMRAVYSMRFLPADGNPGPLPGSVGLPEHEFHSLKEQLKSVCPPPVETVYQLPAGEEPMSEAERKQWAAAFTQALADRAARGRSISGIAAAEESEGEANVL